MYMTAKGMSKFTAFYLRRRRRHKNKNGTKAKPKLDEMKTR